MQTPIIFGIRAVIEALHAGQHIEKVYLRKGLSGSLARELAKSLAQYKITPSWVPDEKLFKLGDKNHQGVVATLAVIKTIELEDLITQAGTKPLFLLLDGITDVRNFGAIARTAACTGVNGIIVPQNHSAPLSADAVKTSAGALFLVPVCKVPHLKDAVYYLQASGIRIFAATEKTNQLAYQTDFNVPAAIVMGAEDKGISPQILHLADEKIALPLLGKIASLNVSVACGAILYEAVRQRNLPEENS